ncbi:MAG: MurNAc alpha-1-phosphate uridylyltransferase [Halieaceae bacterium]|jgi:MurNAc alpha-1-phosphate uridylyltransferase
MILAAGFGKRMLPLTEHTPKPLLTVAGIPLIEHHIRRLAAAGVTRIVINVAHLGHQIVDYCQDGERWGVTLSFSHEEEPLETAGGIVKALPLLGRESFLLVNGDIWTDYPFERLVVQALTDEDSARLILVANPLQHPQGDFCLDDARVVKRAEGEIGLTYAGIGLFNAKLFAATQPGRVPLLPLLLAAIERQTLAGEFYGGEWEDIGTPERLTALNARHSIS